MSYINRTSIIFKPVSLFSLAFVFLIGCGGGSSKSGSGYIHLYNASSNAPDVYLTLDEDITEDDDDEFETTYAGVGYADASGNYEVDAEEYYIELAWQDEDSNDRDDLEKVYEDQIEITKDNIHYVIVTEDFSSPKILNFTVELIDDDNDSDEDLFNLRVLNLHSVASSVDIYLSKSDQSFNEATLISNSNYQEMSENQKFDQDDYVFYITEAGSSEILFQTEEVSYNYPSQYLMVIRENNGVDSSPYVLDKISNSNIETFEHDGAQASFRVFNAINEHQLLPNYQGEFNLYLNGVDETPEITELKLGEFSDTTTTDHGDYSVDLTIPTTGETIIKNHLLTLTENQNKTVFFYIKEEDVDEDGDGDVDEDGDGYVDEIEITTNSLVVTNSTSESIYDNDIQIIHFVDNEDFSNVTFYFVRSDEIIETAYYKKAAQLASPEEITLINNTYTVYAVAKEDSSDIILTTTTLTLTEDSDNLFLLLEQDNDSPTGYSILTVAQ
jgi:hypothetical protein